MKKLLIMAIGAILTVGANAASVGWTLAGANNFVGDAYYVFVNGQNGVVNTATITALLNAGESFDSYVFGSGTVAANGGAITTAANSGKTLTADGSTSYTAFYVIFDSATPKVGESKYTVVSGASGLTQTPSATAASITFAAANQSTYLNNASNWQTYAVPEPTSGLLMLLGMAGLALRRKRV